MSMMNYELKISTDLGMTYYAVSTISKKIEDIKKIALELEKKGEVRWVIVDENDDPQYWCQYIEGNLHIPDDAAIATDDPYMEKLAKKQGRKVLTTLDLMRRVGIKNPEEKLANIDYTKIDLKDVLATMERLTEDGVIERIPSEMDESKIGKELFGNK